MKHSNDPYIHSVWYIIKAFGRKIVFKIINYKKFIKNKGSLELKNNLVEMKRIKNNIRSFIMIQLPGVLQPVAMVTNGDCK